MKGTIYSPEEFLQGLKDNGVNVEDLVVDMVQLFSGPMKVKVGDADFELSLGVKQI